MLFVICVCLSVVFILSWRIICKCYVNFSLILSLFHLDFIFISSWFYLDFIDVNVIIFSIFNFDHSIKTSNSNDQMMIFNWQVAFLSNFIFILTRFIIFYNLYLSIICKSFNYFKSLPIVPCEFLYIFCTPTNPLPPDFLFSFYQLSHLSTSSLSIVDKFVSYF